jgi:hypothetical protein
MSISNLHLSPAPVVFLLGKVFGELCHKLMSRPGVYLRRGFLMYGHLSLSCQVTRKRLKKYLKDTRRLVGLSAALTPVVIMIQPPPFPDEYPRDHVIRGFVTWSSVSEQLSKTSVRGQLVSCEEINGSSVSE